jgi:hypothetical protein
MTRVARVTLGLLALLCWVALICMPAGTGWCFSHRPLWMPPEVIFPTQFLGALILSAGSVVFGTLALGLAD